MFFNNLKYIFIYFRRVFAVFMAAPEILFESCIRGKICTWWWIVFYWFICWVNLSFAVSLCTQIEVSSKKKYEVRPPSSGALVWVASSVITNRFVIVDGVSTMRHHKHFAFAALAALAVRVTCTIVFKWVDHVFTFLCVNAMAHSEQSNWWRSPGSHISDKELQCERPITRTICTEYETLYVIVWFIVVCLNIHITLWFLLSVRHPAWINITANGQNTSICGVVPFIVTFHQLGFVCPVAFYPMIKTDTPLITVTVVAGKPFWEISRDPDMEKVWIQFWKLLITNILNKLFNINVIWLLSQVINIEEASTNQYDFTTWAYAAQLPRPMYENVKFAISIRPTVIEVAHRLPMTVGLIEMANFTFSYIGRGCGSCAA